MESGAFWEKDVSNTEKMPIYEGAGLMQGLCPIFLGFVPQIQVKVSRGSEVPSEGSASSE